MLKWMTLPASSPDQLFFDPDLPPSNPPVPRGQHADLAPPPPWPTTFNTSTQSFCFDQAQEEIDFDRSVWGRGSRTESTCQGAWETIVESFLPANHAVSFRKVATFSEIASTTLSVETYTSAKRRYLQGLRADPEVAGSDDIFSSESSQSAHSTLTSTTKRARTRLVQSPLKPDLLIRGLTFNRGPRPDKFHRLTLTGEIKPWTGFDHVSFHVAYLAQAIKYAIISRDMFANRHSLLCVGMRFRRILALRGTNDLLIDVRTEDGDEGDNDSPGSIVITLELDEIFRYGYIKPPPAQQDPQEHLHPLETLVPHPPSSAQSLHPTSPHEPHDDAALDIPPSSLFYRLYPDTDPLSTQPYGVRSRRALKQFLTHMGQAHLDACRGYPSSDAPSTQLDQESTSNNFTPTNPNPDPHPLLRLSGKWARVTNVTLEKVGEIVCGIRSVWDTIPPRSSVGSQSDQSEASGGGASGDEEGDEEDDGVELEGDRAGDQGGVDVTGRFSMDTVRGPSTGVNGQEEHIARRTMDRRKDYSTSINHARYLHAQQRGTSTAPSLTRTGSSPSQSVTAPLDPRSEDRIVTPTHASTSYDGPTPSDTTQLTSGHRDDPLDNDDISVPTPRVSQVFDEIMRRKVEIQEHRQATLQRFGWLCPLE